MPSFAPWKMTASDSPHHTGWYARLFAWVYAHLAGAPGPELDRRRRALMSSLSGTVLEIGPGIGANLPYLPRDVRWIGVEPNPFMLDYLHREAQRLGKTVDARQGVAERLDLPDNSIDTVVSTHVLCSVDDLEASLREIKRVLKPGGRLVFIEHVAAPRGSRLRRLQQIVKPVWQAVGDGCHPDRETWAAVEAAGFSHVDIEYFQLKIPIAEPHIMGAAVK